MKKNLIVFIITLFTFIQTNIYCVEKRTDLNLNEKLYHAAFIEWNPAQIKEYINEGADPNYMGKGYFTVLSIAVTKLDLSLVKYLLENGADPNIKVMDTTALGIAKGLTVMSKSTKEKTQEEIEEILKEVHQQQTNIGEIIKLLAKVTN